MTVAITTVIPGAHTLDQLQEPTLDGQPDEDANENCLAASLAEGLNILLAGGAQQYVGDELHDAVYGQGYIGPQAAWKYVAYCNGKGVYLHAVGGSQAALVATIHREVSAGHPVIVTMPSAWNTAPADPVHPAGSTHCGLAVGVGTDAIRVMNPWHGFMQDATDEWWMARLCEGEVWVMEKVSAAVTIAQAAGQPTPFYGLTYTSDAQTWACPATGKTLSHGFLNYYQGLHGVNGATATQIVGLPLSGEYGTSDGKTRQDFERGSLIYDASAANPWMIYCAPVGKELAASAAQLTQAQQTITQLRQQVATLEAQLSAAQSAAQSATGPTPTAAATAAATPTLDEVAQAAARLFGEAFAQALATALAPRAA